MDEAKLQSTRMSVSRDSNGPESNQAPHSPVRYVVRHWRGEFSLAASVWINGTIALFGPRALLFIVSLVPSVWNERPGALRVFAGIWSFLILLWCTLQVWSNVGIWRSSTRHTLHGGTRLWAYSAKLFVLAAAFLSFGLFIHVLLSEWFDIVKIAFGRDPHGHAKIELSPDGTMVSMSGALGEGSAADLARVIHGANRVATVRLSSPGGRMYEALAAAKEIRALNLDTRAEGRCYSACALIFIAGRGRSMAPDAALAFHKPSFLEMTATTREMEDLSSVFRGSGVTPAFIDRIRALRDGEVWYPTRDELVRYKVIPSARQ